MDTNNPTDPAVKHYTPQQAAEMIASATEGPALVREGASVPQLTQNDPDVIKLSDGREARILNAKGNIIPAARRIMAEDGSNFQDCMVALVTVIDGRPIIIEELYELPLKDALAIQARFNEKNA